MDTNTKETAEILMPVDARIEAMCPSKRRLRRLATTSWLRLMRVETRIQRVSAVLFQSYGLSAAQFDVLIQLGSAEGASQQQLADRLLVTKGNVCGLIDHMEKDDLVVRRADPHDRRFNRLYLTEHGRAVHDEVVPQQEELLARIFGQLEPQDAQNLQRALRELDHRLTARCSVHDSAQQGQSNPTGDAALALAVASAPTSTRSAG